MIQVPQLTKLSSPHSRDSLSFSSSTCCPLHLTVGHRTTPTWVAFGDEGPLVGTAAKNASDNMAISPENIVFDARRLIGRCMEDPEVQKNMRMKQWPFNVHADNEGKLMYNVKTGNEHRDFTPVDISAMVLGQSKEAAEAYLGVKVEHAASAKHPKLFRCFEVLFGAYFAYYKRLTRMTQLVKSNP
jgi:hypothetical protein